MTQRDGAAGVLVSPGRAMEHTEPRREPDAATDGGPGWRPAGWAAAGLAGFLCFVFRDAVFGGGVLFRRDISMVWLPQVETFVRVVGSGAWPLWDPFRGFGQPLLADPRAQVLYPPTWLNLLVPPGRFYTAFAVLHLLLAGLGLNALARRWGLSAPAAFTAAVVWIGSGPMLSLASLWHHAAAAAYLPWVLWSFDVACQRRDLRGVLLCGSVVALQVFAGSPEISLFTLAVAGACALLPGGAGSGSARGTARALGALAAALGVGAVLSAAQWLPTLAASARSGRRDQAYAAVATWSLHPLQLLETLLPLRFWDFPLSAAWVDAILERKEPWMHSVYAGAPVLALCLLAALVRGPRRLLLAALGAGSLLFALGRHTPAHQLLIDALPPLGMARYPVKILVVTSLAWALAAGLGLEAWRSSAPPQSLVARGRQALPAVLALLALLPAVLDAGMHRTQAWRGLFLAPGLPAAELERLLAAADVRLWGAAGVAAAAALVAWLGRRHRTPASIGIAVLVVLDLALVHKDLHPVAPAQIYNLRPAVLDVIRREPPSRVYVHDYSIADRSGRAPRARGNPYLLARQPPGWPPAAANVLAVHMYLNPPTAARWGVAGSYDADILDFYPGPLRELVEAARTTQRPADFARLLRLGSVDYALELQPGPWSDGLEPVAELESLFRDPIRVRRVPATLPRAFVVTGARSASDADSLAVLLGDGFDPSREVVLAGAHASSPAAGAGAVRPLERQADRLRFECDLESDGHLVLTEGYDPGWRARVDGEPAGVRRANAAFLAVPVPAGLHSVELAYRPRAVAWGAALSAAAWLAWAAVLVRRRGRG